MKKKLFAFVLCFVLFCSFDISAYAKSVSVSAQSAVLMCAENGKVLFSKNADKKLSMASTTKIMTSLLALEYAEPYKEITVTKEMVNVEGTSMGLMAGDSVSLEELVYGMLLQSGNDAANSVAYVVSGNPEEFAKLMNKRADEIGMKNTNFVTASGLDDKDHFSTAYDMALLACESIKNKEFASICSRKSARLTYGNPPYARTLTNHNRLLWKYEDTIGIKTGFTKKSGRCLVSAAKQDGVTLVAVTLNAPDDWNDHISMFEYGFSVCKSSLVDCDLSNIFAKVAGGEKDRVSVALSCNPRWVAGEKCSVRLLLNPINYAPVKKGDIVGTAVFLSGDKVIENVPVLASENIYCKAIEQNNQEQNDNSFSLILQKIKDFFKFSEVK